MNTQSLPASFGHWQDLDNESQVPHYLALAKHCGPKSSVLDVGCGTGLLSRYLHPGSYYEGIDANPHAVLSRIHTKVSAFTAESFEPGISYDVIVFNEMLYYCKDPIGLLKKYRPFLTPNGRFIISIYRNHKPWSFKAWFKSLFTSAPTSNEDCYRMVTKFLHETGWDTQEQVVKDGYLAWDVITVAP